MFLLLKQKILSNLMNCKPENVNNIESVDPNSQIAIIWSVEDVQSIKGCSKYSKKKCLEILKEAKDNHDCNYGITWESLEYFAKGD